MRKAPPPHAIRPMAYQLPEDEFRALKLTRDYALMLADLAAPVTQAEADEPVPLNRFAIARCFERFAADLDEVISKAWWPGE